MKVTQLEVENFCKITALNIALGEHITEISGENGAGKSSTLNALWVLLKGKRVAPEQPIRKGSQRCRIRGKLGEYLVTRIFTKDKHGEITTQLRIERGDEGLPATEAFMRELIGEHMLDPGDFIALSPAEKFDVFRSFVPEVDFKLIANQNRKDYDRRTDVNRLARDSRSAAGLIHVPDDTPEELVDVTGLVSDLRTAGDENADIERRRGNREKLAREIESHRQAAQSADAAIAAFTQDRQNQRDQRITELEALIARARQDCERDIEARSIQLREGASRALAQAEELQAKLDAAGELPQLVNLEALQRRISDAQAINENVKQLRLRRSHDQVADRYERESTEITARMEERERTKQEAIAKANLPIAGITFGEGEILLNGVPFEQASTALKLKCGVAIAVAKNPTLRLVWIRDASLLDDKSYETVKRLAKEFDAQILLETVRPIGNDAIVLEDGHLKQQQQQAAATAGASA